MVMGNPAGLLERIAVPLRVAHSEVHDGYQHGKPKARQPRHDARRSSFILVDTNGMGRLGLPSPLPRGLIRPVAPAIPELRDCATTFSARSLLLERGYREINHLT